MGKGNPYLLPNEKQILLKLLHIHHAHNYDLCFFFRSQMRDKKKKGEKAKLTVLRFGCCWIGPGSWCVQRR